MRQLKVRDSATLVRGTDKFGHFDPEPRPKPDLDEAALAAHADAVGRQVKALYQGTDKNRVPRLNLRCSRRRQPFSLQLRRQSPACAAPGSSVAVFCQSSRTRRISSCASSQRSDSS